MAADPRPGGDDRRPRVLIAGGGVAALEAAIALRVHLGDLELDLGLLSPREHFVYRPLAVLEPFAGVPTWTLPLARFAGDQDVEVLDGALAEVDPERHVAIAHGGAEHPYDRLLIATGARPSRWLEGSVLFRDAYDAATLRELLDEFADRGLGDLVLALPPDGSWSLPAYELALQSARTLRARGAAARVTVVTPEAHPLEAFGAAAGAALARRLRRQGVALRTGATARTLGDGVLGLRDGAWLPADRVVTLPRLVGRPVRGLPHTGDGFLPVDELCRVEGARDVYAAGDVTSFPLKQGGIACQMADTAAEAILAGIGLPISPHPFRPVLQGVLLGDDEPLYLRAAGKPPHTWSPWWPPTKIAGRHLGPYMTLRVGAPRTPERRKDPAPRAPARPRPSRPAA